LESETRDSKSRQARGLFLSLDGIDGTGKSTQVRLLADWLRTRGRDVVTCVDPGGTPIGDALRDLVLDHRREMSVPCEALLFMASRAELVARVIRPALEAGAVVLSDRFLLATVVYQGHGGGMDVDDLWRIGRFAAGGVEPDLTIVLDLPIELAERRRGRQPDRLEQRDREFHERVRNGFLVEARKQPDRIRVVDAAESVDVVQERIQALVAARMAKPLMNTDGHG
jgi:dTMP kinase